MIADILTYVDAYEEVRAVTGLNAQELPDATIALRVYANRLSIALGETSGIYTPETTSQTLQEIFDRPLAETDEMYGLIQNYSIYTVADAIMRSIGLRAYKHMADGKATITRFSPESAYQDTAASIAAAKDELLRKINDLLGVEFTTSDLLSISVPSPDLVTGE